jgi:phosphatidylglycerophosphate synthase
MNAAPQKITAEQNRSRVFTIPNLLTLFRIVVTPLFFILFYYFPTKIFSLLASVLFALASFTDFLDGYIARRWNLETSLGFLTRWQTSCWLPLR